LLFQWLKILPVQSHISCSTYVVSLYINSCILTSFLLPFAHSHPQVLPHLTVFMFSLFVFNYLLLLLLLLSSPLWRVFILIFPRQTMSLGNTVLQLFCCYYWWCLYR
jgi:hypothetical protein